MYVCIYVCMYVFFVRFIEHAPLPSVVLHAVFQTMYIDFLIADIQSLLIQQTHRTPSGA